MSRVRGLFSTVERARATALAGDAAAALEEASRTNHNGSLHHAVLAMH